MTQDLRAAEKFYGAVLGWEFQPTRLGDEFSVAFAEGAPVAGIGALSRALQVPVEWTPYFAVDDADATADRIRERSATVAVGPLRFGTGRAALAADRDGAVFGIWQGKAIPDWRLGRDSAPAWLELRTRDAFDAAIFYAEILDWACEQEDCCQVAYEDDHVVLRRHVHTVARITGGRVDAAPDPRIRPCWHVYFYVPDIEKAVRTAVRLGGSVVSSTSASAAVPWATLRDPDGGVFSVSIRRPEAPRPPLRAGAAPLPAP
ncbi:VOC family protein [Streptomyces sp. WMMC940]|uniref:VOC family protein n=1 Tax=Streptomyces sp. WMMC940 TaxID=3015153 RepID=UPI0022B64511|nr:VOC family protein [Streptomyces sp. WMMC940]MCZ7456262.1 VOC family protein [Streptomyces sp. WMMC940]